MLEKTSGGRFVRSMTKDRERKVNVNPTFCYTNSFDVLLPKVLDLRDFLQD